MARENVGVINCPFTGQLSVVREDKRGKLYYYSAAGKIAPNLHQGQSYLRGKMQPLTAFSITELAPGAPPMVKPLTGAPEKENPLTDKAETEKPLTAQGVTQTEKQTARKRSLLDELGL